MACRGELHDTAAVTAVCLPPLLPGTCLTLGSQGDLKLWDLASGGCAHVLLGPFSAVACVAGSAGSSGSSGLRASRSGYGWHATGSTTSLSAVQVVVAGADPSQPLQLYTVQPDTGFQLVRSMGSTTIGAVHSLAVTCDGQYALSGCTDCTLKVGGQPVCVMCACRKESPLVPYIQM